MSECFNCGIDDEHARLSDAIHGKGIVKVCERCSFDLDVPIIKRNVPEAENKKPVRAMGYNPIPVARLRPETSFRDLVDRSMKIDSSTVNVKPRADLVENFHWIIMRARRFRKLSQAQLAGELGISESSVSMAEKGLIIGDDSIIDKLEGYLRIKIRKNEKEKSLLDRAILVHEEVKNNKSEIKRESIKLEGDLEIQKIRPKEKDIKIADLVELKKQRDREARAKKPESERIKEELEELKKEFRKEHDFKEEDYLSKEDKIY